MRDFLFSDMPTIHTVFKSYVCIKYCGGRGFIKSIFFFSKKIKSKGEWYDKKRKKERE